MRAVPPAVHVHAHSHSLTHHRKTQTEGDPSTGDWERRRQHREQRFAVRALPKPVSKRLAQEPAHACPCPYTGQSGFSEQVQSRVLSLLLCSNKALVKGPELHYCENRPDP